MRSYDYRLLGVPVLFALAGAASCRPLPTPPTETTMPLADGWTICPSAETTAGGAEIATPGFDTSAWTGTTVPATPVAALFRAGKIEDPYFGDNLERLAADRFAGPWWYRTEFEISAPRPAGARLVFEGINYSADVWLNGTRVEPEENLVGAFRIFDIDVREHLVAGVNALAVLVHPPQPGDPTIGFVDWNPTPPDRSMGLWRGVHLRLTGDVALDDVFVHSDFDVDATETAAVTVSATVTNSSDRTRTAVVTGAIEDAGEIRHTLELAPGEQRRIVFTPNDFPQLLLDRPRLWWPNNLGEPELYSLEISAVTGSQVSDRQEVTFGIRKVEDSLDEQGRRRYRINGEDLLIRGGGWVDDMLLADDDQRLEDQLRYVRHMNLNTIRLEGFWGNSRRLFELADRYGILVMVGWSCQWEWEDYLGGPVDKFGGIDTPEEMELVTRSLADQVVWLRNHPSIFLWVLASDMLPRPELERRYADALATVDPTRPTLAACATDTSRVSGPTGVKMNGPYDWVPPNYWYLDRERGGAYGFNSETGPGPQPPPVESIRRMLPQENWWPIDEMWHYHCGRNEFNTLDRYRAAFDARYGEATDLDDFALRAQVANYEGMRAMFESFSIRRPATTGIIQWMLNSAWPEMYWQLYDHYLVPNGAFYGARDANRPLNIAYDYEHRTVVVVNDTAAPVTAARARVRVLDLASGVRFEDERPVNSPAGTIRTVLEVPRPEALAGAYFLDLRLLGADGEPLVSSLYWLSSKDDVPDWDASEWFVTPTAEYADLKGLARIADVELDVDHRFATTADGHRVHVRLSNRGERLAFFVELRVMAGASQRRAAPVVWSDNYVSLFPGEEKHIVGDVPVHALGGEEPVLAYRGINVAGRSLARAGPPGSAR